MHPSTWRTSFVLVELRIFHRHRQIQSDNVQWMEIKMSSCGPKKSKNNLRMDLFEWIFRRHIKIEKLNVHGKNGLLWLLLLHILPLYYNFTLMCFFFFHNFSDGRRIFSFATSTMEWKIHPESLRQFSSWDWIIYSSTMIVIPLHLGGIGRSLASITVCTLSTMCVFPFVFFCHRNFRMKQFSLNPQKKAKCSKQCLLHNENELNVFKSLEKCILCFFHERQNFNWKSINFDDHLS